MSNTKESRNGQRKQVVFADLKSETSSTIDSNDGLSRNSMIDEKIFGPTSNRKIFLQSSHNTPNIQLKRPSISVSNKSTIQSTIDKTKEKIVSSVVSTTKENESQSRLNKLSDQKSESLNGTITSELGTIDSNRNTMSKIEFYTSGNGKEVNENQATIDLLYKIRNSASAVSIGPMPLSQRACRFELPFDLKLLETITPLEYLTKYCRLPSRRQYQFKRIFNKHRNKQHLFDSSNLYLSMLEIHQENLTRAKFDYLCQLMDLDNQSYQFTFDTYAGILALCERVLYNSSPFYKNYDDDHLTKDIIEKCDFYSLDRKFDGLVISDTMRRLLNAL